MKDKKIENREISVKKTHIRDINLIFEIYSDNGVIKNQNIFAYAQKERSFHIFNNESKQIVYY